MSVATQAINARSACDELRKKVQADYVSIHPDQLEIPEDRLRVIKPKSIRSLADSIKEVGLMHPIGVKYAGAGTNRFIVIYGARRTMAIQLLRKEALERAADPNTDPEVFRYSQVHALRFRKEIDEETCRELEIRENLDRKELTSNERKAHTLRLGAITQERQKKRKNDDVKGDLNIAKNLQNGKAKRDGPGRPPKPVMQEMAESLGISRQRLQARVESASKIVGKKLDLDTTPPDELIEAADAIEETPPKRKGRPSKGEPLSKGNTDYRGGLARLECWLYPADAQAFAGWVRARHPDSFTLDNIRAYRDALIDLVKELES